MATQKGTLNGLPIFEDSGATGVPLDTGAGAAGDVLLATSRRVALGRSPIVVDTVAALGSLDAREVIDGQTYQTLRYSTSHAYGDGSANLYRWVDGDSTTSDGGFVVSGTGGRFHAVDKSVANVMQFGAVGDGVVDDEAACNAAHASNASTVWYPPSSSGYQTTDTVTAAVGQSVVMDGRLLFTGTPDRPIFQQGVAGEDNDMAGRTLALWAEYSTTGDWSDASACCIVLRSTTGCENIAIKKTFGGYAGLKVDADADGFTYNTIRLGRLLNHCRSVWVDVTNSGWCNQNVWIGGSLRVNSNTNAGTDRYGVYAETSDATNANNNANTWIGPSFELSRTASNENCRPLALHACNGWQFYELREESNCDKIAEVSGSTANVTIKPSFVASGSSSEIDFQDVCENCTVILPQYRQETWRELFASGNLGKAWSDYDGAGAHLVRPFNVSLTNGTYYLNRAINAVGSDSITTTSNAIFLRINFYSGDRRLRMRVRQASGDKGRIHFACYSDVDGGGSRLTDTEEACSLGTYNGSTYGGAFILGADVNDITTVQFSSAVDCVDVFFANGTWHEIAVDIAANAQATLNAPNGQSLFDTTTHRLATAAPSVGAWLRGDVLHNATPTAGGTIGWVCTAAGSPGTWKTFGAISA